MGEVRRGRRVPGRQQSWWTDRWRRSAAPVVTVLAVVFGMAVPAHAMAVGPTLTGVTSATDDGVSAPVTDHDEIVPGVGHSPLAPSAERQPEPQAGVNAAAVPPANDAFAAATKISALPFTTTDAPYGGATLEAGEPKACRTTDPDVTEYFTDAASSIWYSYTSPRRQTLTFAGTVNGRSTVVNAYPAAQLSALQRVSCVEDEFRETNFLQAEAGKTYYFQIGETGGGEPLPADATARLTVSGTAPISNTTWATATAVSVPATVEASLAKVDYNWYEPYIGCRPDEYALMGSLWYKYTAPETGRVKVDVGDSFFDADFAVYDSDGTTPGNAVACPQQASNSEGSGPGDYDKTLANAAFDTVAGRTYFIQVGGFGFSAGDAVIELSKVPAAAFTTAPVPTITGTATVGSTLTGACQVFCVSGHQRVVRGGG